MYFFTNRMTFVVTYFRIMNFLVLRFCFLLTTLHYMGVFGCDQFNDLKKRLFSCRVDFENIFVRYTHVLSR